MSDILVNCLDCGTDIKEKDAIQLEKGYICCFCLEKRNLIIEWEKKKKKSLEKWL